MSDRVAVRDGVVEACVKDGLADEAKVHATREVADVLFKVVVRMVSITEELVVLENKISENRERNRKYKSLHRDGRSWTNDK